MIDINKYIRDIPDFPKPGIIFKDITPLLQDPGAFKTAVDRMVAGIRDQGPCHAVVGIESRGFIFGTPVALELGVGFVPIRKPGKLPWETASATYDLEYGTDSIEIHKDALTPGQEVVIVDDLLATGGTMEAAIHLVESLGAKVAACSFVVELDFLKGRKKLGKHPIHTLIHY